MQKQYIRRMMIKPHAATIRKYTARLSEINGYLKDFPPHQANKAIPMDELLKILEFTVLVSWQHQMTHHGIEPSQQTIAQFVKFYDYLESTEEVLSGSSTKCARDKEKDKDTHRPPGRNL